VTNVVTAIVTAIVTAYCGCRLCCGPTAPAPTASGAWPKECITVAAPRAIPFGTVVEIEGVGRRVAQDRTSKRFEGRWDIYFEDHRKALEFGKRTLRIRIYEKETAPKRAVTVRTRADRTGPVGRGDRGGSRQGYPPVH
jgi:3D (Asp-Asp-Asp) domain-containing protein